jgi:GT2 family glycosyltransferase
VVVDNDDLSGRVVAATAAASALPVPLRLVREEEPGASNARNRGIAEATGSVIAFLDDDVVPEAAWLQRLVAPLLEGGCQGVGGRVELDPSTPLPGWFNGDWMAGYLAELDLGPAERDLTTDEWVLTANAAFLTDALRRLGGFDLDLGPRKGVYLTNEDVDLCRRFMARVGPIRYVPGAVVVHELPQARLRRRYIFRRMYAQGRSDWQLDRRVLADSFLDGVVGLAWPRIAYVARLMWDGPIVNRAVVLRAVCELGRAAGMLREAAAAARAARLGQAGIAGRASAR